MQPEPMVESPAPGRLADGRFSAGNTAALKHGRRSRQLQRAELADQAEARAALAERRRAIENDLGGTEQLSELTRDMVGRYLELDLVCGFLAARLATQGPLTGKGRTKAALTAYLAVVDRQTRLAQTLGLERKARRVQSLEEVLRAE